MQIQDKQIITKRCPSPAHINNIELAVVLSLFAIHILLALVVKQFNSISTLHALATLGLGLLWVTLRQHFERAAYVAAYITGAEVLWRMTHAGVFWEYGKYATVIVFVVAMLRDVRFRVSYLPILYFALLLPSIILTTYYLDFDETRNQLSFNLSGPLSLMISVLFFSRLKFAPQQLNRLLIAVISPIVSIATLLLLRVASVSDIEFSNRSSNFGVTGFGPNQVAATLSLGALLVFFYLLHMKPDWRLKVLMFVIMVIFLAESALTFSRGGIYMFALSAVSGAFYLIRDTKSRINLVLITSFFFIMAHYVVFPNLDSLTDNALSDRYANTYTSGREEALLGDFELWKDNILFGTGPGVSSYLKDTFTERIASHTEFSRLLVEHGMFGVISLLLLLAMALQSIRGKNTFKDKAFTASLLIWSFTFMTINGMRLMAPSFLFGLAFTRMLGEKRLKGIIVRKHVRLKIRNFNSKVSAVNLTGYT